jgi:cell division protein FtsW (lipid II flippase)
MGLAKDRIFLLAAFLCPVIAGTVFMAYAGAPYAYPVTNGAAAGFVAITFWRAPQIDPRTSLLVVAVIVPGLLVCTFAGPAIEGVHRWVALGPLKLHSAMLVLPFFATQMFRHDKRLTAAVGTLVAVIVALQPDRASAFALFLTSLCWLYFMQDRWSFATLLVSGAALVSTMLNTDTVLPVSFVEHVMSEAALVHSAIAALLTISMLIAIAGPVFAGWRGQSGISAPFAAWSACLAGYFLASLAGPYPVPLLGYGVSSILGFGLALAVVGQKSDKSA